MNPGLQVFAIEFMKKIIPEVEGIIEAYKRNPEEGLSVYLDFLKRIKPSVERIVKGQRHPYYIGLISPRLLRDPLSIELMSQKLSSEEKEAHIVGYLKAIIQLGYCEAKGLEGWQFSGTSLHKENLKIQNVGKINSIPLLIQIVKREIFEAKIVIKEGKRGKEEKLIDVDNTPIQSQKGQKRNDENEITAVPFTARLMAYYRAKEYENDAPLIVDPFAKRLAGDMTSYIDQHSHVRAGEGGYSLVRSYYIEKNLLTPWCKTQAESQIVLLGAGLDTRVYRFKPFQTNTHTIFEIDFSVVNRYKEKILQNEQPLCDLVRISADLSNADWAFHLINSGFSKNIPTFWVLEGLVYYMEREIVESLLKKAAEITAKNSQIFVDICIPIFAEVNFGSFLRYFKWGLNKETVPSFFATAGWDVLCFFADDYDQGRDVGQRGMIFVHGVRAV
ncbi:MAG: class I SAM-dependent methyltransferase [Candidatus Hermodarchaeota archaeon]